MSAPAPFDWLAVEGINLSRTFATLLDLVQDRGSVTLDEARAALEGPLGNQFGRLEHVYRQQAGTSAAGADGIRAYVTWALAYLVRRHLLAPLSDDPGTGARWGAGAGFERGKRLVVVPAARAGGRAITHTVLTADERRLLDAQSHHRETVGMALARLRPGNPGLRPVTRERVEALKDSVARFGKRDDAYPILVDQEGRILSGRHRAQAAKELGVTWRTVRVPAGSDDERLAIAWLGNETHPWTPQERARLAKLGILPDAVFGRQATRERIADALRFNAQRSNAAIARELGTSDHTVQSVRQVMEETSQIARFVSGRGGRGRTERDAALPAAAPATNGTLPAMPAADELAHSSARHMAHPWAVSGQKRLRRSISGVPATDLAIIHRHYGRAYLIELREEIDRLLAAQEPQVRDHEESAAHPP